MTWPPPRPSVFTPFLRRFTDEKAREVEEIRALFEEVQAAHLASPFRDSERRGFVAFDALDQARHKIPEHLEPLFTDALKDILKLETVVFDFPAVSFDYLSVKEQADLRKYLYAKKNFLAHQRRVVDLLIGSLTMTVGTIGEALPRAGGSSLFNVPLITVLPEAKERINFILSVLFADENRDAGLFGDLTDAIYRNICVHFGNEPYGRVRHVATPVTESDLPVEELVEAYFRGTPLLPLLRAPVPLEISFEDRFSHMHIVGGSGAGKTTLLQHLVLNDLYSEEPPALIIVDSQGDLINKLSRLNYFAEYYERFVYISPKDTKHPPALNIFDVNRERLNRYDDVTKEQVTAGVIQTFDYLFSGLIGADLTAKQSVFFRFVARLMLALPETMGRNATILDMIRLMDNAAPYAEAIRSLPPIQREFFERDFPSKTFAQTKEQIRYRLNSILENPTLARLFTSPTTKVDFFTELNKGSVIFVDTAKDFLKGSSAHFGRIFISLVLQAVLERAAIPEKDRKPAFLIVDEAASYFDSNIDDLLTEARKYKLGCVFAHQFLDQATYSLRSSLAANTSIKLAAGVSVSDARAMAPDMRTTPDFILAQPKLHFACHIRNVTPQAVSIPVQPRLITEEHLLSDTVYAALLDFNRARVSLPETLRIPTPEPEPQRAPDPDAESTAKQRYAAQHAPLKPKPAQAPPPTATPASKPAPASSPADDDSIPSKEW